VDGELAECIREIRKAANALPIRRGRKAKPADESTEDTDQK
jgi:hypothetical protein